MVKPKPYDIRVFVLTLVQKISEKILGQIAVIEIVVTKFRLDAGLWKNCVLGEKIAHDPLLIVVFSKSIRVIMEQACAIREPSQNARLDDLTAQCITFSDDATRLQGKPVPGEKRVELVKGRIRWAGAFQNE